MDCPKCGLFNTEKAEQCDCGHVFVSHAPGLSNKAVERKHARSRPSAGDEGRRRLVGGLGSGVVLLLFLAMLVLPLIGTSTSGQAFTAMDVLRTTRRDEMAMAVLRAQQVALVAGPLFAAVALVTAALGRTRLAGGCLVVAALAGTAAATSFPLVVRLFGRGDTVRISAEAGFTMLLAASVFATVGACALYAMDLASTGRPWRLAVALGPLLASAVVFVPRVTLEPIRWDRPASASELTGLVQRVLAKPPTDEEATAAIQAATTGRLPRKAALAAQAIMCSRGSRVDSITNIKVFSSSIGRSPATGAERTYWATQARVSGACNVLLNGLRPFEVTLDCHLHKDEFERWVASCEEM